MPMEFRRSWMNDALEPWRDAVVRFVENEIVPRDEAARKRGHVERELWRMAGASGLLCVDISEVYGGGGGDFRYEALIHEELARRGLTGMSVAVHSIAAHYIVNHGTEEQKRKYLPAMASGELIGAIAMTEPSAGSDLQGIRTRAERRAGGYVINGSKTFISNGFLADLVLVVAKTDPGLKSKGISILIVETKDRPGYKVGRLLDKIGFKAQDTAELFFDNVEVDSQNLLGGVEGQGFAQLMSDLPYERTLVGLNAIGSMEGAFEATLRYAKERSAFGQPIFDFQNTRFKLAEIAAQIAAARAYVDKCVEDFVEGRLDTAGASMLKMWSTDLQGRVMDECLQLFGGYGYMNEYPIARMFVDARVQRIYGGTNEIMKEVVSRAL